MNLSKIIERSNSQNYDRVEDDFEKLIRNLEEPEVTNYISNAESIYDSKHSGTSLLNAQIKKDSVIDEEKESRFSRYHQEGTEYLNAWKLLSVFPARITELNRNSVIMEVIIDEDEIEEQEYGIKFFEGFDLQSAKFFKIECYERANEQRLVMKDASGRVKREDFPKVDFSHIKNSDIFF